MNENLQDELLENWSFTLGNEESRVDEDILYSISPRVVFFSSAAPAAATWASRARDSVRSSSIGCCSKSASLLILLGYLLFRLSRHDEPNRFENDLFRCERTV